MQRDLMFCSIFSQLAEKSFRFYRNVSREDPMPESVGNEWNDLRARVDEMVKNEQKISKFECKELCKLNINCNTCNSN